MNDKQITIDQLKTLVAAFVTERDWNQFHTPKNLSMNIAVEAAELMEKFRWVESQGSFQELVHNRQEIEDELADVLMGIICFANATNIDLSSALRHKIIQSAQRYPVEKAKGKALKYDKL